MRYHYTTPVRPPILSTARIPRNMRTASSGQLLIVRANNHSPHSSPSSLFHSEKSPTPPLDNSEHTFLYWMRHVKIRSQPEV